MGSAPLVGAPTGRSAGAGTAPPKKRPVFSPEAKYTVTWNEMMLGRVTLAEVEAYKAAYGDVKSGGGGGAGASQRRAEPVRVTAPTRGPARQVHKDQVSVARPRGVGSVEDGREARVAYWKPKDSKRMANAVLALATNSF